MVKVKLRKKPITGERQSLYLDFWPAIQHPETGLKTRREFLGLYIFDKAKDIFDKEHNKQTLQIAEQIRQKRENNLNKPEVYTEFEREQLRIKELGDQNFVPYFKKLADKRKSNEHDNWISSYNYFEAFAGQKVKFSDLNERFCNEFRHYLLTTPSQKSSKTILSKNSASSYFNRFKATLKQAFKDGLLQVDLNGRVESIKLEETKRNFLTLEELNELVKTPCKTEILKKAALFSAMTGLRFSDIHKLIWSEIHHSKSGYSIEFTQQKTKGVEFLPISNQAFNLLGERKGSNDLIFEGLTYSAAQNTILAQWVKDAGIGKKITFHAFRHSYATLQISEGTDIYTVSKLLGHKSVKTTAIYAKVVNKLKIDAANRIKLEM